MMTGGDKNKSDRIMEAIAKSNEQNQIVDVEEEKIKLVIFTLRDNYFAFYGQDVKEVLPLEKVIGVPGSPVFILGIVNIRGDLESLLDISGILNLPAPQRNNRNRIVIAESAGIRSGILASGIEDVLDVPVSAVKEPLTSLSDNVKPFVKGETAYKGKNVTLLDIGKIFQKALAA